MATASLKKPYNSVTNLCLLPNDDISVTNTNTGFESSNTNLGERSLNSNKHAVELACLANSDDPFEQLSQRSLPKPAPGIPPWPVPSFFSPSSSIATRSASAAYSCPSLFPSDLGFGLTVSLGNLFDSSAPNNNDSNVSDSFKGAVTYPDPLQAVMSNTGPPPLLTNSPDKSQFRSKRTIGSLSFPNYLGEIAVGGSSRGPGSLGDLIQLDDQGNDAGASLASFGSESKNSNSFFDNLNGSLGGLARRGLERMSSFSDLLDRPALSPKPHYAAKPTDNGAGCISAGGGVAGGFGSDVPGIGNPRLSNSGLNGLGSSVPTNTGRPYGGAFPTSSPAAHAATQQDDRSAAAAAGSVAAKRLGNEHGGNGGNGGEGAAWGGPWAGLDKLGGVSAVGHPIGHPLRHGTSAHRPFGPSLPPSAGSLSKSVSEPSSVRFVSGGMPVSHIPPVPQRTSPPSNNGAGGCSSTRGGGAVRLNSAMQASSSVMQHQPAASSHFPFSYNYSSNGSNGSSGSTEAGAGATGAGMARAQDPSPLGAGGRQQRPSSGAHSSDARPPLGSSETSASLDGGQSLAPSSVVINNSADKNDNGRSASNCNNRNNNNSGSGSGNGDLGEARHPPPQQAVTTATANGMESLLFDLDSLLAPSGVTNSSVQQAAADDIFSLGSGTAATASGVARDAAPSPFSSSSSSSTLPFAHYNGLSKTNPSKRNSHLPYPPNSRPVPAAAPTSTPSSSSDPGNGGGDGSAPPLLDLLTSDVPWATPPAAAAAARLSQTPSSQQVAPSLRQQPPTELPGAPSASSRPTVSAHTAFPSLMRTSAPTVRVATTRTTPTPLANAIVMPSRFNVPGATTAAAAAAATSASSLTPREAPPTTAGYPLPRGNGGGANHATSSGGIHSASKDKDGWLDRQPAGRDDGSSARAAAGSNISYAAAAGATPYPSGAEEPGEVVINNDYGLTNKAKSSSGRGGRGQAGRSGHLKSMDMVYGDERRDLREIQLFAIPLLKDRLVFLPVVNTWHEDEESKSRTVLGLVASGLANVQQGVANYWHSLKEKDPDTFQARVYRAGQAILENMNAEERLMRSIPSRANKIVVYHPSCFSPDEILSQLTAITQSCSVKSAGKAAVAGVMLPVAVGLEVFLIPGLGWLTAYQLVKSASAAAGGSRLNKYLISGGGGGGQRPKQRDVRVCYAARPELDSYIDRAKLSPDGVLGQEDIEDLVHDVAQPMLLHPLTELRNRHLRKTQTMNADYALLPMATEGDVDDSFLDDAAAGRNLDARASSRSSK